MKLIIVGIKIDGNVQRKQAMYNLTIIPCFVGMANNVWSSQDAASLSEPLELWDS